MTPQDVTGENAPPMDTAYMKNIRFFLTFMDSWPNKELGSKKRTLFFRNSKVLLIAWTLLLISNLTYLIKNFDVLDFAEKGHSASLILNNFVQIQRLLSSMTKSYTQTVVRFVREIHLVHYINTDEYSKKMFYKIEKYLGYFEIINRFYVIVAGFFFNLMPLINNFRLGKYGTNKPENVSLDHATYLYLPFDYTSKFGAGYIVVMLLNIFLTIDSAVSVFVYNILLIIILIHLWGHLKILRHNLETFPKPSTQSHTSKSIANSACFNDEENERITEMLKENIEYHKCFKGYMSQFSATFGLTLCCYHAYYLTSECILLIESTQLEEQEKLKFIPVALLFTVQLIQMSFVFEALGSASEILKDVAYSIPWESMNVKNQKILLFYLANLQEPFNSKAMGILLVGVQTMAAMLKTVFSYFMLMRALVYVEQ